MLLSDIWWPSQQQHCFSSAKINIVNCCAICLELSTLSLKVVFFFFKKKMVLEFLFEGVPSIFTWLLCGFVKGSGISSEAHLFPTFLAETLRGFCIDSGWFMKKGHIRTCIFRTWFLLDDTIGQRRVFPSLSAHRGTEHSKLSTKK